MKKLIIPIFILTILLVGINIYSQESNNINEIFMRIEKINGLDFIYIGSERTLLLDTYNIENSISQFISFIKVDSKGKVPLDWVFNFIDSVGRINYIQSLFIKDIWESGVIIPTMKHLTMSLINEKPGTHIFFNNTRSIMIFLDKSIDGLKKVMSDINDYFKLYDTDKDVSLDEVIMFYSGKAISEV